MGYKLVCSKCGYVIDEYSKQGLYVGVPSPTWHAGHVCPKCGHVFKGRAKRILFDGEVVYEEK